MRKQFLLLFLLMTLGSLGITTTQASIWESTKIWTIEEEDRYSNWVKENWKADIFINPDSPYFAIPTDCADAAYAMRIIYAFENKLPFKIYSRAG